MATIKDLLDKMIEKTNDNTSEIIGLKENGVGGADWNQNDKTAKDYIKNRPFYTSDPVETVIVEETTVTIEENAEEPVGILTATKPLEVGQEYIITLDGTVYNCVCKMHEEFGMPYMGNIGFIGAGEDTGEPFFVAPFDSETVLGIMNFTGTLEYVVSIASNISEIHHIDPKYIKDMYYKKVYEVEPLPQSSLLFGQGEFDDVLLSTPLIADTSYTVNLNGKSYECVAEAYDEYCVCIYNIEAPFYIETFFDGENCYTYMNTPSIGTYTISIYNNTDSVEVLSETSVEIEFSIIERVNDLNEMLVENAVYTVTWDGVEYECVAKSTGCDNEVYMGNPSIDSGEPSESNEPFYIFTNLLDNFSIIIPAEEGIHDVRIVGVVKEYHTIDKNYLPNLIGKSGEGENSEIFNNYRNNVASGQYSHAEGSYETEASGNMSHAEGYRTVASGAYQHVQGKFNINNVDAEGNALDTYAHIVGNGTNSKRSNAHTLDWKGNAWYQGTVEGTAMIVKSSTAGSSKRFKITVDDSGTISAVEI